MNKRDRDETIARLVEKGVPPRTVADALGVHLSTVYRATKATKVQEGDQMTDETPMSSADKILAQLRRPQSEIDQVEAIHVSNVERAARRKDFVDQRIAELKAQGYSHNYAKTVAHQEADLSAEKRESEKRANDEAAFLARQSHLASDAGQLEMLESHLKTQRDLGVPESSAQRVRADYLRARQSKIARRMDSDQI